MKQQVLTLALASILVFVSVISVVAQGDTAAEKRAEIEQLRQQREAARTEARATLTAERESRIQERCAGAQAKIATVLERTQTYRNNQADVYNNWRIRLDTFVNRLGATDIELDLTQLTENLATLDGLTEELSAAFMSYVSELTSLSEIDCQSEPQAFQDALLTARDYRTVVVNAKQALKEFVQTTIKADLQTIKDAITSGEEG